MSFKNTKTPTRAVITGICKYQLPSIIGNNGKLWYQMTPELKEKFCKLYPTTPNPEMMKLFGIGFTTLQRYKKSFGLKKRIKVIRRKTAKSVVKMLNENGYYDSLRGKAPSQACKDGYQRLLATGYSPMKRLKEKDPKKYSRVLIERSGKRKELEANERFRVEYGLPQKTRLHRPMTKYNKQQVSCRFFMKKYGYILGDVRESTGERYVIYWDEQTARNDTREANARKCGFTIKELIE